MGRSSSGKSQDIVKPARKTNKIRIIVIFVILTPYYFEKTYQKSNN